MTYCADGRCAIIYTTLDMLKKLNTGDDEMEGLASIPRQIEGVLIGITMREKEGGFFKISVRTNNNIKRGEFLRLVNQQNTVKIAHDKNFSAAFSSVVFTVSRSPSIEHPAAAG